MPLGQAAPETVRIVVADDDPLFARIVRARISARPEFEVVGIATNGLEAVELNDQLAPDVVVMDAALPVVDGHEPAEVIRDRPDPPTVVLVTGEDSCPGARAYAVDATAYVRKPADLVGLMDIVIAISQFSFT